MVEIFTQKVRIIGRPTSPELPHDLLPAVGGPALVPASPADLEKLESVAYGRNYRTKVTFNRSDPLHNWYWGFVQIVADGIDRPAMWLHRELKKRAGLIKHIYMDGVVELTSTAKDKMDETEFLVYVQFAKEIVFRDFLPGVTREHVWKRVEEWTGQQWTW